MLYKPKPRSLLASTSHPNVINLKTSLAHLNPKPILINLSSIPLFFTTKNRENREREMDMSIYLHFLDSEHDAPLTGDRRQSSPQHRWYVIEEIGDQETAPDDELGEDRWIDKSEQDRVRCLRLPRLTHDVFRAAFVASNSRLFFIGGRTVRSDEGIDVDNGIIHIDLQDDLCWKRCGNWGEDIECAIEAAVSEDGNSIVVVGDQVFRFRCHDVQVGQIYPLRSDFWPTLLLAISGSTILTYKPSRPDSGRPDHLGYYNVLNRSWNISKDVTSGPIFARWAFKPSVFRRSVLVRNSFLIYFGLNSPSPMVPDYGPALYVYDILRSEWLPEPVGGLRKDGIILPSETGWPIYSPYLMQVRRDALKLAVVWSLRVNDTPMDEEEDDDVVRTHTEVHWSKFVLRIHDKEEDNIPPTFFAESLSCGTFYGGKTLLVHCAAG